MIGRAWHWISSLLPFRYLRAAGLFVLAAFGVISAWRYATRRDDASDRVRAARTAEEAKDAYIDAQAHGAKAAQVKRNAERRIDELERRGHVSMAQKVRELNEL